MPSSILCWWLASLTGRWKNCFTIIFSKTFNFSTYILLWYTLHAWPAFVRYAKKMCSDKNHWRVAKLVVTQDVTQHNLEKRKLFSLPHPHDYEVHSAVVWSIGQQLLCTSILDQEPNLCVKPVGKKSFFHVYKTYLNPWFMIISQASRLVLLKS